MSKRDIIGLRMSSSTLSPVEALPALRRVGRDKSRDNPVEFREYSPRPPVRVPFLPGPELQWALRLLDGCGWIEHGADEIHQHCQVFLLRKLAILRTAEFQLESAAFQVAILAGPTTT